MDDLHIIMLGDVTQPEKDKYHVISLICGIQKDNTNELIYQIETDSQTLKTNLWLSEGKGGGAGYKSGVWN